MKTRTQAIKEFLDKQPCKVSLYTPEMEVQVNVIKGSDRLEGKIPIWTNGVDTWAAFRIPSKGAGIGADPTYTDSILSWDISKYAEAIGLSGWDWFNRVSRWVGFDFDSIATHSTGLRDEELDDLRQRVKDIPWITLRRSKSGLGYHIYVFFETPVPTQNHTEHSALAKAVLSQLSGLLNFDFASKVDTAGGILWIWHKDASDADKSFKVIKEGVPLKDIPVAWRDFIQKGKKRKTFIDNPSLTELISATKRYPLDEEHQALLFWLANQSNLWWWDAEKGMLVTHTYTLKQAHEQLKFKGLYTTLSKGKELPSDHNCFAFPIQDGAWLVYRYNQKTKETDCWSISPSGWTFCIYNKYPTFNSICKQYNGLKTKTGTFKFPTMKVAIKVLQALGINLTDVPIEFNERETILAPGKVDNEIVITVSRSTDDKPLAAWYQTRGPCWERIVSTQFETRVIEPPDEVVRHVTLQGSGSAWFVKARNRWVEKQKTDIKSALVALGYAKSEVEGVIGMAVVEDWQEVIVPFDEEYPGDRKWNRKAPQLLFDPKPGAHPTWDLIFDHVGKNISVADNEWCKQYGINNGAEYLKLWYANILRHPLAQLPYLFLVSTQQNTGKSIFHEAFQLLLRDGYGYTKADHALTNDSGFNGELYGAVLAVVEEVNLSKAPKALERIKDYVTAKNLFIRRLNQNGFMAANTTHWIQCANDLSYCPVFPGDTRITVVYVEPIQNEIPKDLLLDKLRLEASHILYTLLNLELPPPEGRLRIPVLSGSVKSTIQDINKNLVQEFIDACCVADDGCITPLDIFITEFINWLDSDTERHLWDRNRIRKAIPALQFPQGVYGSGAKLHIGNLRITKLSEYRPFSKRVVRLATNKLGEM